MFRITKKLNKMYSSFEEFTPNIKNKKALSKKLKIMLKVFRNMAFTFFEKLNKKFIILGKELCKLLNQVDVNYYKL